MRTRRRLAPLSVSVNFQFTHDCHYCSFLSRTRYSSLLNAKSFLERTRQERIDRAQALIRSAFPVTVLRTINVLYPYTTFEGTIAYRKVPETREVRVRR